MTLDGLTKAILMGKEYDRDEYIRRQNRIACRGKKHHPFGIEELVCLDILSKPNLKTEKKQYIKLLEQKYRGIYYGKAGVKIDDKEWRSTVHADGSDRGVHLGDLLLDEIVEVVEIK